MTTKLEQIEKLAYFPEDACHFWVEELAVHFSPRAVADLSDFDRSNSTSCLISISPAGLSYWSDEYDNLLEQTDLYFYEVIISGDKPLTAGFFWRYPQGSKAQKLDISAEPFLAEQAELIQLFHEFSARNKLLVLTAADLLGLVPGQAGLVSVYYKYFTQADTGPQESPYPLNQ